MNTKKRKILFFSMCLCGLMILSLSQFLWEITVSGGEVYSESDILKYVTDNYYHIGTLKYQIDCDALEDHLREDYAEIAWASCSIQGTRLHIEIKETLDRKTKQNPKKPCDIVANKSGIITKMAVKSGTPLVSVGDSVKSGTTLISGLIYYYSDDFTVTQTDKIKADGEIVMRTKEVYNNSIPMEYYEKLITGKKKSIKNLYFGQYQFDFPEKKRQDHTNVMTKRRSLKIGKSYYSLNNIEKAAEYILLTAKEASVKLTETHDSIYLKYFIDCQYYFNQLLLQAYIVDETKSVYNAIKSDSILYNKCDLVNAYIINFIFFYWGLGDFESAKIIIDEHINYCDRYFPKSSELHAYYNMLKAVCLKHLDQINNSEASFRKSKELYEGQPNNISSAYYPTVLINLANI